MVNETDDYLRNVADTQPPHVDAIPEVDLDTEAHGESDSTGAEDEAPDITAPADATENGYGESGTEDTTNTAQAGPGSTETPDGGGETGTEGMSAFGTAVAIRMVSSGLALRSPDSDGPTPEPAPDTSNALVPAGRNAVQQLANLAASGAIVLLGPQTKEVDTGEDSKPGIGEPVEGQPDPTPSTAVAVREELPEPGDEASPTDKLPAIRREAAPARAEVPAPAEEPDRPTGASDQPPEPPEGGDRPVPAEQPDRRPEGERLDEAFDAKKSDPPTPEEHTQVRDKEASVDWMGFVTTRSPVAVAFGDEDAAARAARAAADPMGTERDMLPPLPPRLAPEETADIVDRQLDSYADTVMRVTEGAAAAQDIAELTDVHTGRTAVLEYTQTYTNDIGIYPGGGYAVNFEDGELRIDQTVQPTGAPEEFVPHVTPAGEVRLTRRDGSHRTRAHVTNGQLNVTDEQAYAVHPSDSEYFDQLATDLRGYQDTLVRVAEHAGFQRGDFIDAATGRLNREALVEQVGPAIARPEVQAALPPELWSELLAGARSLAERVNATYATDDSIVQRAFRLGGYFRAQLGRTDS